MRYHKQKAYLKLKFVVLLTFIFISFGLAATKGLDFVVIVDQSGSMSGTRGPASDQLGVRNDMVKRTFELLAKDGILNKVTHRLGVISFGDDARIDLPISRITPESVERLRRRLDSNLSGKSLGSTHFLAAFESAKTMFVISPKAGPGKRIILLITDGAPYIAGIKMKSYKESLKALVKSSFPHPTYKVHVVALNDPSSDYWKEYRDFWRDISHNNARKLKGDREHIFESLHDVINNILGIPAVHISVDMYDNLIIPPYLESIVFDIFRDKPGIRVDLFPDKSKEPLSPESENVDVVNVGRTIQTVNVKNPVPGRWKVRKSDEKARVDIYLQKFFPRGKLLFPKSDEPIGQFEKIFVKYRVEDGNNNPLEELDGYPLTLELCLVKPDDSRIKLDMQKTSDPLEKSVFLTSGEIECNVPGSYKTEVLIATKDLKNRDVTLFKDQYSMFQVESAKLIMCNILSPASSGNIPPFENLILIPKPLLCKFKFVFQDGNSVNLPAMFGSIEDILKAYSVKENKEQEVPVTLNQQEEGILVGKLKNLGRSGKYHLRFRANESKAPPDYTIRIDPGDLFFTRHLTILHWLQIIIVGLIALSLLTFLGYKFYVNKRFPLKGKLYIDRLGDKPVAEYPLGPKRHRQTLKVFPNETMIKKIKIKSKHDKSGGIIVTVKGEKRKIFLTERTLYDRGTAILKQIPYVLRFRLK